MIETVREADTRYKTFLEHLPGHAPDRRLQPALSRPHPPQLRRQPRDPGKGGRGHVPRTARLAPGQKGGRPGPQAPGPQAAAFRHLVPGLAHRPTLAEEELDKIVRDKYPNAAAFEKDLPSILVQLGFSPERAAYIAPQVQVDPARGSGHNAQTQSRKFKSRLRTRVPAGGMNYKGYNIALHEFGHAVENVLDLYLIDHYSLAGVPNGAFTEAFAYIFQERDLEMLGIAEKDPRQKELKVLDTFWSAYEIMGVSLVDMQAWHWLYDHPQATPAELKEAVIAIAKEVWNQYFAPVFGVRDQVILAVYSHMIDYTLYLPHYALGNVIQFQLEDYLKDKVLGPEMERMCAAGNILPQLWMKNAVGAEISVKPLLKAVDRALKMAK